MHNMTSHAKVREFSAFNKAPKFRVLLGYSKEILFLLDLNIERD